MIDGVEFSHCAAAEFGGKQMFSNVFQLILLPRWLDETSLYCTLEKAEVL